MTYVKINPMCDYEKLSRGFGRAVHTVANEFANNYSESRQFSPVVDILEDNSAIYFNVELPGVLKDNVKLSVNEENILTIKGEKKFQGSEEIKTCCRHERLYGEFSRSFQLPDNVDSDKIEASYDKGILNIKISKIEPVKPKEVSVTIN